MNELHKRGLEAVGSDIAPGYSGIADGTAVTAQDVAASLEAARSSQLYKERFAHVQRITTAEDDTVTVQLREADHLFAWLLDIPLMLIVMLLLKPDGLTAIRLPKFGKAKAKTEAAPKA